MRDSGIGETVVSRRNYILGGTAAVGGVGILTMTAERTRAEVDWDTLNITGGDATLSSPPSAVTVSVGGSYEISGPATVERSRVILQIIVDGTARDMAETDKLDSPMSGSYSLSADILGHPEVEAAALIPEEVGETASTELTIRVILLAIRDGSIADETTIETTRSITLTRDGLTLAVRGSGEIQIEE